MSEQASWNGQKTVGDRVATTERLENGAEKNPWQGHRPEQIHDRAINGLAVLLAAGEIAVVHALRVCAVGLIISGPSTLCLQDPSPGTGNSGEMVHLGRLSKSNALVR